MTRSAAALLTVGYLALVGGVALVYPPAGLIVGGVLALVAGALSLEAKPPKSNGERE